MFFEWETPNPNNEAKLCNLWFHHRHSQPGFPV